MVVKSGGNWKRPVNRMYTYNFQVNLCRDRIISNIYNISRLERTTTSR